MIHQKLIYQAIKFAGVGLIATLVHVALFTVLVAFSFAGPMVANFLAFCAAFWISLYGHFHWSFSNSDGAKKPSLAIILRFLMVSSFSLFLNTLVVYSVEHWLHLSYMVSSAAMLFVVPPITFLLSRYWVFAQNSEITDTP